MIRLIIMAGLLGLAISTSNAQSTDVVQHAVFELKAIVQTSSAAKVVRLNNRDIVAALNASGAFSFGTNATLLLAMNGDQPDGLIVQDGPAGQGTNTDVSAYFAITEVGDAVASPDGSMVWETWHFGFDNGNTDTETAFELWGSTTIRHVLTGSGTLAGSDVVESNVRGAGVLNGATAVFSGTLSAMNFSSSKNKR